MSNAWSLDTVLEAGTADRAETKPSGLIGECQVGAGHGLVVKGTDCFPEHLAMIPRTCAAAHSGLCLTHEAHRRIRSQYTQKQIHENVIENSVQGPHKC